ncbi:type IV pili methyl-accepting chemotaxis transducer N-terminal domain-containing protein [filamentous cyanobacterium LEGE 11480]|uniref:histidine kinase n=1 Tax=Romeriopsis navalis LEGE 11480 TaxID=2777977 RepID=A0A928VP97_9CYAN|nr:ATP-binding protein [Romeriopsis navalis]MBE9031965.1 type IV pili methyl-accepting chemotaxis transducer N-terminal domain-containing protein [Romeriopsis navalis LEGE 11480]
MSQLNRPAVLPVAPIHGQVEIDQREIDASILNLSGRQRMLSQRVALFLMRLSLCQGSCQCQIIRQELQQLLQLLAATHQSLMYGDIDLRLPSHHSQAIHQIYFAPPVNLDRRLTQYVQQVEYFLAQSDTQLAIDDPALQQLISIDSVDLLQALETLVSQYSQESEARQTARMMDLVGLCQQHEKARQTVQNQADQLNQALSELNQAQAKLVQNEKMAGLRQLVAGVAHEINNPVTFIHGNLTHAKAYSEDLTLLLQAYQTHYPHPVPAISEYLNEIDADFLIEDFPKTMASMHSGTERLRRIVLSLRNFARLDEAECKVVDIHEGLESTLLLLQHKFHQFECQYGQCIEIQREYADLPLVPCHASQLNQVFMALLTNAIDALDHRQSDGTLSQPPWIRLITQSCVEQNQLLIQVVDSGIGIAVEHQSQVFNPFFTTKPVGQGTGLGLAIAYQMMAQQSGSITCESELGCGSTFTIRLPLQPDTSIGV